MFVIFIFRNFLCRGEKPCAPKDARTVLEGDGLE